MSRYADREQFSADKVLQQGDGIFQVDSATLADVKYMVLFDIDGMPRCDCFDWKRFHLPCKHFCAVFHLYPEYGWSRLPAGYRDSPFFRVDEAIVGAPSHVQQSAADSTPQLTAQDDADTAGLLLIVKIVIQQLNTIGFIPLKQLPVERCCAR